MAPGIGDVDAFALACLIGATAGGAWFLKQVVGWIRDDRRHRRVAKELREADSCARRLPLARPRVGAPADRGEEPPAAMHELRQDHRGLDMVTSSLADDLNSRLVS